MKYNPTVVRAFFKSQGLPEYVSEHTFHHTRKWRFDFAWLDYRIALEVEGGIWVGGGHNRGKGFSKDVEKYNNANLLGWHVLRCVPKDICTTDTAKMVLAMIEKVKSSYPIYEPN
jgi:hypothetical protein